MSLTILTTFFKNKQDVIKIYENYKKNLSSDNIKYFFVNDNFQDEVWNEIQNAENAPQDTNSTAEEIPIGTPTPLPGGTQEVSVLSNSRS